MSTKWRQLDDWCLWTSVQINVKGGGSLFLPKAKRNLSQSNVLWRNDLAAVEMQQYRSQNWGPQCSVKLMSALSTREYFDIFTTATSCRPQSAVSLESQLQVPAIIVSWPRTWPGLLGWDTRHTKECGTFIPASVLNRIWDFLHSDLHQEGLARIF